MRIIGNEGSDNSPKNVVVHMTGTEWNYLQTACGIPYDKQNGAVGNTADADKIDNVVRAYRDLKDVRKSMIDLHKKWEKTIEAMDSALASTKPD
jgi:hypothetical protein